MGGISSTCPYNGTTATAYVDGQNQGEGPVTADTAVPGNGLELGVGDWGFADLAVYPTALTPARSMLTGRRAPHPRPQPVLHRPYPYAKSVLSNKPDVYYPLDDVGTSRVAYARAAGATTGPIPPRP